MYETVLGAVGARHPEAAYLRFSRLAHRGTRLHTVALSPSLGDPPQSHENVTADAYHLDGHGRALGRPQTVSVSVSASAMTATSARTIIFIKQTPRQLARSP